MRYTFISNLAKAGIHPKQAMDLARHSDINLTMARYSHTLLSERADAVYALPDVTPTTNQPQELAMTGTDDQPSSLPSGLPTQTASDGTLRD